MTKFKFTAIRAKQAAGHDVFSFAATPQQVKRIARGHLLLAAANGLAPGVFGVSSWDLVGALPVPLDGVKDRVGSGDYRWVNRGGVDLMGSNPEAVASFIQGQEFDAWAEAAAMQNNKQIESTRLLAIRRFASRAIKV